MIGQRWQYERLHSNEGVMLDERPSWHEYIRVVLYRYKLVYDISK
jgi:hypothetical protein